MVILRIYDKRDAAAWNECVKSFDNWDIYYLYEYAYSFMLHGDGNIFLIYYENNDERFCYVVMQSDIADFDKLAGRLEQGKLFDWETPYGYGGPLTNMSVSNDTQELFLKELGEYCKENNIVSQFVRFHPLLRNDKALPKVFETRYLRDTIYIDTSDKELIMQNMDSKNRNMVRKAIKNNISVVRKEIDEIDDFIFMYNETMKKNDAEEYYTFGKQYFDYLMALKENAGIFYAMYDGKPVSGAIMYYNDNYMHYHLAGSNTEFKKYAPNNLLLYEAACWACEHGIKKFHLGGGMSPDDSLFGFKKQFNDKGRCPFVVGRTVFDLDVYDKLLQIRKEMNSEFDANNEFMVRYRR
ncbi:MAG: GNAT family N-acetyltransferase [Clostridium sp.]|nr:GNAT family N-acetyltransferase [Clostridium sp.]